MRLFLAVELDDAAREALAEWQSRLRRELRGWRFMAPEGLHLTLRFLGEVPADDVARHRPLWAEAAAACAPVDLTFGGLGVFPPKGVPRVLWVGVVEPEARAALAAAALRFEEAARRAGFPPETRPFRPHLTLARARRGARAMAPPATPAAPVCRMRVSEAVLMESRLGPGGARYTLLERYPFRAEPGS